MKKINERKLIAEIRKKSLKAAGGGIAQLVKAKHIQDLCKQWKLTRRNERKTKNALKSMGNGVF